MTVERSQIFDGVMRGGWLDCMTLGSILVVKTPAGLVSESVSIYRSTFTFVHPALFIYHVHSPSLSSLSLYSLSPLTLLSHCFM